MCNTHKYTHATKRFLLVNTSHSAGPSCTVNHRFIQALQHHQEMERWVAPLHTFSAILSYLKVIDPSCRVLLLVLTSVALIKAQMYNTAQSFRNMSGEVKRVTCCSTLRSGVCMCACMCLNLKTWGWVYLRQCSHYLSKGPKSNLLAPMWSRSELGSGPQMILLLSSLYTHGSHFS